MIVRHVVGCMSGTSCDGIDASLVRIEGTGLDMTAQPIRSASVGLGLLGDELMEFARGTPLAPGEVARLSAALAAAHAKLIRDLVVGEPCDLVAIHGQTVFHDPPLSWQLIEPSIIAEALGAPVVSNLRAADLARGGQGAPITPIADWILLRDQRERRAIVNLGGFCNATILPASARPDDTRGFDVCACNQLLDTLARITIDQPFDTDGIVAASGSVNHQFHATLVDTLSTQANATRSLGSADEPAAVGDGWTESLHALLSNLKPADVLRTA
ncbi:MAG: anhydro-N-acetylmuramic acid kinase, partial [Planctomycetota bacterium]